MISQRRSTQQLKLALAFLGSALTTVAHPRFPDHAVTVRSTFLSSSSAFGG